MGVMTTTRPGAAAPSAGASGDLMAVMKSTEPWVRVASATLFISALLGLAAVALSWFALAEEGSDDTLFMVYILGAGAVLQFLVWRAVAAVATGIRSYVKAGDQASLVNAMKQSRGFWQLLGILSLIGLALTALAFAAGFQGG